MTRHAAIRLLADQCTSCLVCVVECPAWCIELSSHSEPIPDLPPGARERTRQALDTFTIDYGRCLLCGICIEQCPFDALEWSAEPAPSATRRDLLVLGIDQLSPGVN